MVKRTMINLTLIAMVILAAVLVWYGRWLKRCMRSAHEYDFDIWEDELAVVDDEGVSQ